MSSKVNELRERREENNALKSSDFLGSENEEIMRLEAKYVALEQDLREQRKNITWFKCPHKVVYHFVLCLFNFMVWFSKEIFTHSFTKFIALPSVIVWLVMDRVEGSHEIAMYEIEFTFKYIAWWIGLGILSSVGLGTGMHSGILFLFPHIFKVVTAAEECGISIGNGLDPRLDSWFYEQPFHCTGLAKGVYDPVPFYLVFLSIYPSSFLWGFGTAIGEIPPYALSRAAKLANKKNEDFEEIMNSESSWNIINKMTQWMVNFLQKSGFWGVFLMSAWPNMAFDLCGICCGHFLMPFGTFFSAVVLGKAVVKIGLQALFFITLFSEEYLSVFLQSFKNNTEQISFMNQYDIARELEEFLYKQRDKLKQGDQPSNDSGEKNIFMVFVSYIIPLMLGYFLMSAIEQFAQYHATECDEKHIESLKKLEDKKIK